MDKTLDEVTLHDEIVYDGTIVHLHLRTVRLPDGAIGKREIVKHQGAVALLIRTKDDGIILVKQYRSAIEGELLEAPAGKRDPGESFDEAAAREMEEETGLVPRTLVKLGTIYSSPGFSDELLALYYCEDHVAGAMHLDRDEFLTAKAYPLAEVARMIAKGELHDAKTLALWALAREKGCLK